ncbi:MAG: NYN domain-containing protein [Gammaproteobacteria bacterium]
MKQDKRIALLIDCENVSHSSIEVVLEELANYGAVNVRHVHGNWESVQLRGWKSKLLTHSLKPMQQFPYTPGKNASDIALIIDAMDLLYSKNVDAFAIMTSDSDFTPLAVRIRESGFPVYGFGESKTPKAFEDACSTFFNTKKLISGEEKPIEAKIVPIKGKIAEGEQSPPPKARGAGRSGAATKIVPIQEKIAKGEQSSSAKPLDAGRPGVAAKSVSIQEKITKDKQSTSTKKQDAARLEEDQLEAERLYADLLKNRPGLAKLLKQAIKHTTGDDGWSSMSTMGSYMSNYSPFSPKNYGHQKLSDLIKATGLFYVEMRNDGTSMYICPKFSLS